LEDAAIEERVDHREELRGGGRGMLSMRKE
jgi:hypothetical protein